jgi:hypothetical protein
MAAAPPFQYDAYSLPLPPPEILNLLMIVGTTIAIVGGVITLLAVLIGGIYLLLKGLLALLAILKQMRSGAGSDHEGGELELAEIAQLPPAPRHDPRFGPAA